MGSPDPFMRRQFLCQRLIRPDPVNGIGQILNVLIMKQKLFLQFIIKNILRLVVKKSPTGVSTHYFSFVLK